MDEVPRRKRDKGRNIAPRDSSDVNRDILVTEMTYHVVFAEDAYFEHAQNNEIIRMASGHAHDTICDVFPSPVCSGAHPTKSQLVTRN